MKPGAISEESNAHNKVFEHFAPEKRCGPKSSAALGPFCFVDRDYTSRVQPQGDRGALITSSMPIPFIMPAKS